MAANSTYSFLDVHCAIAGPGGGFALGSGSGAAEEGITISFEGTKNTMVAGADGSVMHNLSGRMTGKAKITLLKTSPVNAMLSAMFNFQRFSGQTWGQNVITVSDIARGDVFTNQQAAFTKHPDTKYAVAGGTVDWEFDVGVIDPFLGVGIPDVNV